MLGGLAWPTQPHSPSPRSTRTSSRASPGWWSASREAASPWRSRSRRSRRASGSPGREQRNWRRRSARWRCCWRVTGPRRSPHRRSRSHLPVARRRKHMAGRKKIIIVDDDRETREMLKMALELEGYEVSQAANGLRLISTLHVDRPDLILAGSVIAGDHRVEKPGQLLDSAVELRVKVQLPYVSRGGFKLEKALEQFALPVAGRVCVDLGASTGGFTDVLLQRGALRVHAVDVGYGQLHPRLRADPRVVVHERVNARELRLPEPCSAAVADPSFISLRLVLPALAAALRPADAWACVLVKPQFEAGRAEVGKGGVVRDPLVHERVVREIAEELEKLEFEIVGSVPSPVLGPAGNREYLVVATRT